MRRSFPLLAILLAAPALHAQTSPVFDQEVDRARHLLAYTQYADKAWGAYLAARLHSGELNKLLLDQLPGATQFSNYPARSEEYAYLAVLLDALIESGAVIPAAQLEPFDDQWLSPVMILLARTGDNEDLLLKIREKTGWQTAWLAANNLLFEKKSQKWYRALLGEMTISHRFVVYDPGESTGTGGRDGLGACGDSMLTAPQGFPPVVFYSLEDEEERGNILLAKGPRNVYYHRTTVATNKQGSSGSCSTGNDRPRLRFGYLSLLGNIPAEQVRQIFIRETQIPFRAVADFQATVDRELAAQAFAVHELLQAIADKNHLRAADVHLQVVPEVSDLRHKSTDPLPALAPRDVN